MIKVINGVEYPLTPEEEAECARIAEEEAKKVIVPTEEERLAAVEELLLMQLGVI